MRQAPTLLPLSAGQEALWFLHALEPENTSYNVATPVRIRSAVQAPVLRAALDAVTERHALLRSVVTEAQGRPWRVEREPGLVPFDLLDAAGADEAELHRLVREAVTVPFDLTTQPPLRALLVRRSDEDHVLLLTIHHIAIDATSQWILLRDLFAAYGSLLAGEPVGWQGPEPSYHACVEAERTLLASPRREELEAYWRAVCTDAVAAELPTDRVRPVEQTHAGASHVLRLPDELLPELRRTAAGMGVTPFALLLGTWQALLHRYAGAEEHDLLLGCPTTTRLSRASREVVGYLVNTLLLRSHLEPDADFRAAAQAAHQQVGQGMAHLGYPFPLVAALGARARGAAAGPLFRLTFSMLSTARLDPLQRLLLESQAEDWTHEQDGLRLSPFDVAQPGSQFDLQVEIRQSADSLAAVFRYNTDLYDAATVERLADCYGRVLAVAVADPEARIADVPLAGADELEELIALGAAFS